MRVETLEMRGGGLINLRAEYSEYSASANPPPSIIQKILKKIITTKNYCKKNYIEIKRLVIVVLPSKMKESYTEETKIILCTEIACNC